MDPSRANPKTEHADPHLKKLLKEVVLPMCAKSKTDAELPMRVYPYSETADPNRHKERKENVLPKWTKSSTDMQDPRLLTP